MLSSTSQERMGVSSVENVLCIITIIHIVIIQRKKLTEKIETSEKWVLICGRRKTGKTYIVENTVSYDDYFFVNRNRTVLDKISSQVLDYNTFVAIFLRSVQQRRTIVIDEFHRLGEEFLDVLHSSRKSGKVILITSTLLLAKKLLSGNSALLGLFNEIQVDIISLDDALRELKDRKVSKKDRLELAILAREPLAIDYLSSEDSVHTAVRILLGSAQSVPALIGEIFTEEERVNTMVYNGIMSAVATGNVSSGRISSYLFSRKLIQKDDPSIVQQYLLNLLKFGLMRRVAIFNKKKFVYKIQSPLVRLYFYAQEKLGLSERQVSERELVDLVTTVMPRIVEDNVRELISSTEGLVETIIEDSDFEVDGYLIKHDKPHIALEVKWRNRVRELHTIESNLRRIPAESHILFVPDKEVLQSKLIRVVDPDDLLQ